jgi:hypothetical protein
VEVERLLPADAVRPRWSSASALAYAGGIVCLLATIGLLGIAQDDWGDWALVGGTVLAAAIAFALAVVLDGAARAVAAGVAATLGVVFAGLAVGAFLNAIGLLDADTGDYQPETLLVEATIVGAALLAVRRFRAPLPVLPAALAFWVAVADLSSLGSWDDAGEVLSVAAGCLLAVAGVAADRAGREPFGFWLHAVGGLAAGGGLAILIGEDAWALTALLGLAFVALAYALGRSSYAVLGAIGILVATTLFAVDPGSFVGGFVPFGVGAPSGGDSLEGWQIALSYLVAGLVLAALGLAGERVTGRLRRT